MSCRIPEWCQRYVGIPYGEQDCWSLCQSYYAAELGIEIGPVEDQRGHMRARDWVDIRDTDMLPREGDIMLFRNSAVKKHVGLYLTDPYMLHTQAGTNACIESWRSSIWLKKYVTTYRHVYQCPA
jgi:cell wall-associated NlpC family hydrolase